MQRCLVGIIHFGLISFILFSSCKQPKSSATPSSPIADEKISLPLDSLDRESAQKKAMALDTFLEHRFEAGLFNGVCTITYHGTPFYRRAFGYSNLQTKDSLDTESCFQLASVSKPITAYGILLLVQNGKLQLDDSLGKFFPGFPYGQVSVRMLLEQRSGLCNYMYVCDSFWANHDLPMHNADVLRMFESQRPICYAKPDDHFDYCNTNYLLLACIAEKVSGMSFPEYMQKSVFDPLGMEHSFYITDSSHVGFDHRAMGHDHKGRVVGSDYLDGCLGDKGLYSNVYDLARFEAGLWAGKPLQTKWVQESIQPHSPEKRLSNYGYGWRMRKLDERHWLPYHNGWWMGYKNYYVRNIYNGISVIILTNSTKGGFLNDLQLVMLTQ